ncbi:pectin lyase fold/virulence factor [Hyaloraphidium curvatum]|nr:pectin lyase fold/virulence factor [Hyaloraphidium curvatum]
MLDAPGEWFHDAAASTLYFQPANGSDMSGAAVEWLPAGVPLLTVTGSYVTVDNLVLSGGQDGILLGANVEGVTIANSTFRTILHHGIHAPENVRNVTISGNDMSGCGRHGILLPNSNYSSIEGNRITKIGLAAGLGPSAGPELPNLPLVYAGVAVYTTGTANSIADNRIDDVGYHGIQLAGGDKLATFAWSYSPACTGNVISRVCRALADCGAIYARETLDPLVEGNTIVTAVGNGESAGRPERSYLANGIYIDEESARAVVRGNTVVNASTAGIYVHRAVNCTFEGNTVAGSATAKQIRPVGRNAMFGNVFRNNDLAALRADARFTWQEGREPSTTGIMADHEGEAYCPPESEGTDPGQRFSVVQRELVTYDEWRTVVNDNATRVCDAGVRARIAAAMSAAMEKLDAAMVVGAQKEPPAVVNPPAKPGAAARVAAWAGLVLATLAAAGVLAW